MAENQTFFVRHTKTLAPKREDLATLYQRDRFAVHYPGSDERDLRTIDPLAYDKGSAAQSAMKCLKKLLSGGGYVWAQYYFTNTVKIGFVRPGTAVEFIESEWTKYSRKGDIAVLKAVPMTKVREVQSGELMVLRATRPRQGTISKWPSAGPRVRSAVEGTELELKWENLAPSQQEVACAEYLRTSLPSVPSLQTLVLPPGRTLKDVDIVGVAADGRKLLAQVTYLPLAAAGRKLKALESYREQDHHLVLFCRSGAMAVKDGVVVIPVSLVEEWLVENHAVMKWFVKA